MQADRESAIKMMLAAKVHNGSANLSFGMRPYVFSRRKDGTHVINLSMTYEKVKLAARMIYAVEEPKDVLAVSTKPFGTRAVHKFAQFLGANYVEQRFTPGYFTNHSIKQFSEPRLLIICDPNTDSQAIHEAAYANIPTIALCDTDAHLSYVDCIIPCNTKNKMSMGLIMWLLTREVLRLRGTLTMSETWKILPDLYFYRDPQDESKIDEALEAQEDEPAPEEIALGTTVPQAEIGGGATENEWENREEWDV
jgi:small subunit ribosomal protein SAe